MQLGTRWVRLMQRQTPRPRGAEPDRTVNSDLLRASRTAHIVAARTGLPVDHTSLLRERCWGVFEGRLRNALPLLAVRAEPVVVVSHGDVIREAVKPWGADQQLENAAQNGCLMSIRRCTNQGPARMPSHPHTSAVNSVHVSDLR
jgi:broad specificity phosphatase PhoE